MNSERYTAVERDVVCEPITLNRREMLKLLGSGIIILIHVPEAPAALQPPRRSRYPEDFNAFLRIGADGRGTGDPHVLRADAGRRAGRFPFGGGHGHG